MTAVFLFILGAAIGSFLNVIIDRLSQGESILGRSHCDFCHRTLSSLDLVPIVSFFFLKGRCRYCRKRLSYQYPLVETLTGGAFVLSWYVISRGPDLFLGAYPTFGELTRSGLYLVLSSLFIGIFFTDLKYHIIPDEMQIAFAATTLFLKFQEGTSITMLGFNLVEAVLVMLPILLLYLLTRGRGMGFGDVKLALNIGFLLGLKGGLLSLYFGFVIGAGVGILLLVSRQKKLKSKIAFGPFLLMGVWVVLIFKDVLYAYLQSYYGI